MSRMRALIVSSQGTAGHSFNRPLYGSYTSQLSTPNPAPGQYLPNCDVGKEHQFFVDQGGPSRRDSLESTSSTGESQPSIPAISSMSSNHGWYIETPDTYARADPTRVDNYGFQPLSSFLQTPVPVTGNDRLLLDHFIDNILRLAFPVLETHLQGPERLLAILESLKTNKSYFHCCLSVSAIHLKTTMNIKSNGISHDIMRHRYEAVSQLCKTLSNESKHEQILDGTLAMIFFHCAVGVPGDDYLPDIPWHDHFQAAANLVEKLEIPMDPHILPPFNISLATWIDILGATMLGTAPKFAPTYRRKHISAIPTGLREMMGCDDQIMYLISEIACLEALKSENRIDEMRLCQHVSALGGQLEFTEPADPTPRTPYTASGTICPVQLTKNVSSIFRAAARIFLCSLIPGMDRTNPNIVHLVTTVTNALPYVPMGPNGFDRSLVWPLLITGAHSEPFSAFRRIFEQRAAALGDVGDFGSFGRMYRVLQELWRLTDEPVSLPTFTRSTNGYTDPRSWMAPGLKIDGERSPSPVCYTLGLRSIKRQQVHWRDVMLRNDWRYLLI